MAEFFLTISNSTLLTLLLVAGLFTAFWFALEVIDPEPRPMGRFAIGVVFNATSMILFLFGHMFWKLAPMGADQASVVMLGAFVGTTAVIAWGARRRAVDGYGTTGPAFLALVPIACLFLNFKRPAQRVVQRSRPAMFGRAAAFIVVAVGIVLVGAFAKVVMESRISRGVEMNTAGISIERALRIQALIEEASAPMKMDANTTFVGARTEGSRITYAYELAGEIRKRPENQARTLLMLGARESICSASLLRSLLKRGATVAFEYRWRHPTLGLQVVETEVQEQLCPRE
jgi:hypothetical protein